MIPIFTPNREVIPIVTPNREVIPKVTPNREVIPILIVLAMKIGIRKSNWVKIGISSVYRQDSDQGRE